MSNTIGGHAAAEDHGKVEEAERFYASFLDFTHHLFVDLTVNDSLNIVAVTEMIKAVWHEVRYNRSYLMRVQNHAEPASDENYIASHTVRTTIVAMILGTYFKLPNHRLVELGMAALLHDVGMLALPSALYLSRRPLTAHEKESLHTHPVQGCKILYSFHCPPPVSLAVLEHHEREDGTGYPRKLSGDKISLYAKIIAVACSYEALSANRLYKEAKDHHTGIVELLRNDGKRYNAAVVKALVESLSIYPIGLYVLLSDGMKAQVIDINPVFQRFPTVQLLGMTHEGKHKTVNTFDRGVTVVRPLTREEVFHEKPAVSGM